MEPEKTPPPTQRAVNKKQLAEQMGISLSTLKRLFKKANLTVERGIISPAKQQEILKVLGWAEKNPNDPK